MLKVVGTFLRAEVGHEVADPAAERQVYNVANGGKMSLTELYGILRELTQGRHPDVVVPRPVHQDFRTGDVRHSQADIAKARRLLGYEPTHDARAGLADSLPWYDARLAESNPTRLRAHGTG